MTSPSTSLASGFVITPRADEAPRLSWNRPAVPLNHVVVVGSPKGGCGKTSVTLFSATTLAELGARVLLIEATEGQGPLTRAYSPMAAVEDRGLGNHLYQGIGAVKDDMDFAKAYAKVFPIMRQHAKAAMQDMTKVYVTPDQSRSLDFLPCGESMLARVQSMSSMQQRDIRRALLTAFLDAIKAENPEGGWDYIFIDTLPTAESTVTRASIGIADSYALVVDVESSHPLTGFGGIKEEIGIVQASRVAEGKPGEVFRGLILNKIAPPNKRPLVEKVNRLLVAGEQKKAANQGLDVLILAEVPRLSTLTLLGFNYANLRNLQKRYPGGLPEDLNDLTDEDVDNLGLFDHGLTDEGELCETFAGVPILVDKLFGSNKRKILGEAESLYPLLLNLSADKAALYEYIAAMPVADEEGGE